MINKPTHNLDITWFMTHKTLGSGERVGLFHQQCKVSKDIHVEKSQN